MKKRKIGVMIESFRLDTKGGIRKAAEVGADGFQVVCTVPERPVSAEMSQSARREFRDFAAQQNLRISALCADFGCGFLDPARNDELVAKSKKCVDLAVDLGTDVITTHIGTIPDDEQNPKWRIGLEALSDLSEYAASKGVSLACETGPESIPVLKRFLDRIPTAAIGVNYDPANLVMGGFEHLDGVGIVGNYIFHTHAKDGVRVDGQPKEVPLGEGAVDFPEWLKRLDAIGYDGFLTIEREVGLDPVGDITKAVQFLRTL